ncbi:MAG: hypothetical protein KDD47_07975, partial [Acidobacteria bacterium]|nr:hypothetical protein [Acidobacteriota bacterium]
LYLGPEAVVAGHLVSAGYSFEAEPGSRIGGEVVFAGAKAMLAGEMESDLRVAAGALEISGAVGGDVEAEVGDAAQEAPWLERFLPAPIDLPVVPAGLTVGDSARIDGTLTYSAPREGSVAASAASGGVEWQPFRQPDVEEAGEAAGAATLVGRILTQLRRFAALLIFGLLLLWRAPNWAQARIERLAARPLGSLGWGIAGYIGVPMAGLAILGVTILLAVVTGSFSLGRLTTLVVLLGLLALAVLLVGFLAAVLFGAPVLVSLAGGRMLLGRGEVASASKSYLAFVVGLAVFILVTSLPYVGWGLGLLVVLFGLGLLVQWLLGLRTSSVAEST